MQDEKKSPENKNVTVEMEGRSVENLNLVYASGMIRIEFTKSEHARIFDGKLIEYGVHICLICNC